MRRKLLLCIALALSSALVFGFWFFPYFFGSWSSGRSWSQVSEINFKSGEKLVVENRFRSGLPSVLENSKRYIQWADRKRELLISTNHSSTVNHHAFSKDGNDYVIGVGRMVYFRPKPAPAGHWNSWTLTGSPEVYNFIKKYLDARSPGSYAPDTNELAPAGAFKIRYDRLGVEQPLVIVPHGDSPYGHEIGCIRDQGRELIAVPFASNSFAPQKLVFLRNVNSGGWKFSESLTTTANKP